jgi:hypothetical protein
MDTKEHKPLDTFGGTKCSGAMLTSRVSLPRAKEVLEIQDLEIIWGLKSWLTGPGGPYLEIGSPYLEQPAVVPLSTGHAFNACGRGHSHT